MSFCYNTQSALVWRRAKHLGVRRLVSAFGRGGLPTAQGPFEAQALQNEACDAAESRRPPRQQVGSAPKRRRVSALQSASRAATQCTRAGRGRGAVSNRGFTLLELVMVLAILAVVTALAARELSQFEDQRRFEASQRGLQDIQFAVLGSPEDRAADGSRTVSGFVADMGRLPRAAADLSGTNWTLGELLANPPNPATPAVAGFDLRLAVAGNGVALENRDKQVLVPGGWRGPYLRLPLGTSTMLDGWGNAYTSPVGTVTTNLDTTNYARLRKADDSPVTAAGDEIRIIRHLGANGRSDGTDVGYDQDEALGFANTDFQASISGTVEVLGGGTDGNSPATPDSTQYVVIRLFAPNPTNTAAPISVYKVAVLFTQNPVPWSIPLSSGGPMIGPKILRAYLNPPDTTLLYPTTAATRVSGVKTVTLRAGANQTDLVLDRIPPSPIDH